jgi:alpha-amylase/alpha-mannosidase (GH57 family)
MSENVRSAQIVVHGHFYQPPRENPWTGRIDPQPDADPFPDWNQRVHAECYRPNAFVKISGPEGARVVNNFEMLSFNVGPTLIGWIKVEHPDTYRRIIEADEKSRVHRGHGNAMAQAYHHTILPLSPPRDVRTQVRWGLIDFETHFGRRANGIWLPETAASDHVLAELIDAGVGFTVLAPWQASNWREEGGQWLDARSNPIDVRYPHVYRHPDGSDRSITLFFYDAEIARAIAFERGISSAEHFARMFAERAAANGTLVHAATDGETYGHHHKFGELGLAYGLHVEAPGRGLQPTNYAAYLAHSPARREVRIVEGEGTSWSCAHGVGRWKRNCGCHTGGRPGWNQKWRGPLRTALEIVRDSSDASFARLGRTLLRDPWGARDRYVHVLLGEVAAEDFVRSEAARSLQATEVEQAKKLLELQNMSMSMFTSCGWFFNDIAGVETVQILRYAARTLEILIELDEYAPVDSFLGALASARSNDPAKGTGLDIFTRIKSN